jgi:hypothetical protein
MPAPCPRLPLILLNPPPSAAAARPHSRLRRLRLFSPLVCGGFFVVLLPLPPQPRGQPKPWMGVRHCVRVCLCVCVCLFVFVCDTKRGRGRRRQACVRPWHTRSVAPTRNASAALPIPPPKSSMLHIKIPASPAPPPHALVPLQSSVTPPTLPPTRSLAFAPGISPPSFQQKANPDVKPKQDEFVSRLPWTSAGQSFLLRRGSIYPNRNKRFIREGGGGRAQVQQQIQQQVCVCHPPA